MRRASLTASVMSLLMGIGVAGTTLAAGADGPPSAGSDVLGTSGRTTFGLGVGALYGGLGLNVGRIDGPRLTYGSLGCIGGSRSESTITFSDGTSTTERSSETNCGIGAGVLSTAFLPGDRHGLGLSLGLTYDTDGADEVQGHVIPTYNYFFGGLASGGFNLGFAPVLTFGDEGADAGLLLNVGYQF